MILLDLRYEFGENEVLFVKIEAMVPDIWLDTSFKIRLDTSNVVSRSQTPRSRNFLKSRDFIGFIL